MSAFEELEQTFRSAGADAVFDLLTRNARAFKNYRELFSARLMQVRHQLGLPLVETEPVTQLTESQRPIYEKAAQDAARETGELFLADGDIGAAWPYFRAIGENAPVAGAIEKFEGGEHLDRVIEIAFQEGVHPRKGFDLLLQHHGICRAITWFGSLRDFDVRQQCLRVLIRTLYNELAASLKQTVTANEGAEPVTSRVAELIAGRDWLFEGNSYYVDSSHVISLLRYTPELEDTESLRMALEMAEYGQKLAPMFHFRGDPPFDDPYIDHAVYLRALLGENVEAAIAHFHGKACTAEESGDPTPAEVLIDLLVRLDRNQEAIRASLEFFPDSSRAPSGCPSVLQLCQLAEDFGQLQNLARERGDILSFAAGVVQETDSRTVRSRAG
jgi:hypothetical protein